MCTKEQKEAFDKVIAKAGKKMAKKFKITEEELIRLINIEDTMKDENNEKNKNIFKKLFF